MWIYSWDVKLVCDTSWVLHVMSDVFQLSTSRFWDICTDFTNPKIWNLNCYKNKNLDFLFSGNQSFVLVTFRPYKVLITYWKPEVEYLTNSYCITEIEAFQGISVEIIIKTRGPSVTIVSIILKLLTCFQTQNWGSQYHNLLRGEKLVIFSLYWF